MSSNRDSINDNNIGNEPKLEKVSHMFVDSLFQDVQSKINDELDPLNVKRGSIQIREEQNNNPPPSSSKQKISQQRSFDNKLPSTKLKNSHCTHSSADKNGYKNSKKLNNNSSQRDLFTSY